MSDSIFCMLLTVFLLNPSQLWARVIRQESFSFIDETVRYPVSDTFIITAATSSNRGSCEDATGTRNCFLPSVGGAFPIGPVQNLTQRNAIDCWLPWSNAPLLRRPD